MQLALDNALAPFFENNFGFGITKAANLAAIFGMMNFFARPLSGLFSDLIARRYGMRGRLWWLWFVVAGGGALLVPVFPAMPPDALRFSMRQLRHLSSLSWKLVHAPVACAAASGGLNLSSILCFKSSIQPNPCYTALLPPSSDECVAAFHWRILPGRQPKPVLLCPGA